MSFLDDAKKKLTATVNEHGDRIKEGLDKAGRTIDQKTDGKYTDKIHRGTRAAGNALDNLRDDASDPAGPGPTPDPNAPAVEPDTAPGTDPGGASEPGLPSDPKSPTG